MSIKSLEEAQEILKKHYTLQQKVVDESGVKMDMLWVSRKYIHSQDVFKISQYLIENDEVLKKLDNKYTIDQILSTLQEMDFVKYEGKGYQPVYTRTELTDALHNAFGFCTSKEIIPISKMRNICSQTKK